MAIRHESDFEHLPARKYDGPTRKFLKDHGWHSPAFILVEVTEHKGNELPQWWGTDDVVKKFGSTSEFQSVKLMNGKANVVPVSTLHEIKGVFLDMAIGHRLVIRELPSLEDLG